MPKQKTYDFIICGAGSSGSTVASRLAENPDVSVLLLESGGSDAVAAVCEPEKWPANIQSERDWGFQAEPNPALAGRVSEYAMGKVLGGGSSINALAWVQGHQQDWDFIASETSDPRWSFEAVRRLYTQIECWNGPPDAGYRGSQGPVWIEPAQNPSPIADAALEAGCGVGIPRLTSYNGQAQEGMGGSALTELIIRNGKRRSIFRSYLPNPSDRPNLTILCGALVTRITFMGKKASGVEALTAGEANYFVASKEIILSMGAIQTPKLLMQSGVGDAPTLRRHSIGVIEDLRGVGQNLQDHACFDVLFEYDQRPAPRNNLAEALMFDRSSGSLSAPDLLLVPIEVGKTTQELEKRCNVASACWAIRAAVLQPVSRGHVCITGPDHDDLVKIDTGFLHDPKDLQVAITGIERCREIGNSSALKPYRKREVLPAAFNVEEFARLSCVTFHHQTCTAKMGLDEFSVVDGELRVHGIAGLRIADGSVLPKITRGNTMAPCVIVGERAAQLLKETHRIP